MQTRKKAPPQTKQTASKIGRRTNNNKEVPISNKSRQIKKTVSKKGNGKKTGGRNIKRPAAMRPVSKKIVSKKAVGKKTAGKSNATKRVKAPNTADQKLVKQKLIIQKPLKNLLRADSPWAGIKPIKWDHIKEDE